VEERRFSAAKGVKIDQGFSPGGVCISPTNSGVETPFRVIRAVSPSALPMSDNAAARVILKLLRRRRFQYQAEPRMTTGAFVFLRRRFLPVKRALEFFPSEGLHSAL
jgi:hypothetical protein